MLGAAPSLEVLVGSEGFTLLAEKMQVCQAGFVIRERDVIMSSSNRFDRSWSPDVRMHLSTEFRGTLTNMFLGNRLPSGLCIDAGLAEGRFVFRQIKLQA